MLHERLDLLIPHLEVYAPQTIPATLTRHGHAPGSGGAGLEYCLCHLLSPQKEARAPARRVPRAIGGMGEFPHPTAAEPPREEKQWFGGTAADRRRNHRIRTAAQ